MRSDLLHDATLSQNAVDAKGTTRSLASSRNQRLLHAPVIIETARDFLVEESPNKQETATTAAMDTVNEGTPLMGGADGFTVMAHNDRSVSLLPEDLDEDPADALHHNNQNALDDSFAENDTDSDLHHHRRHHRSESHGSVLEIAYESILDAKDHLVETYEEVQETVIEVLQEEVSMPVKPREEGDHAQKLSALALAVIGACAA